MSILAAYLRPSSKSEIIKVLLVFYVFVPFMFQLKRLKKKLVYYTWKLQDKEMNLAHTIWFKYIVDICRSIYWLHRVISPRTTAMDRICVLPTTWVDDIFNVH